MEPDERRRFMDAYRERNNEFYSKQRTFKEVAEWKYQRYLQDYMACVASVDESVGEILDYLKRTGLDKKYDCRLYYRPGVLSGRARLV